MLAVCCCCFTSIASLHACTGWIYWICVYVTHFGFLNQAPPHHHHDQCHPFQVGCVCVSEIVSLWNPFFSASHRRRSGNISKFHHIRNFINIVDLESTLLTCPDDIIRPIFITTTRYVILVDFAFRFLRSYMIWYAVCSTDLHGFSILFALYISHLWSCQRRNRRKGNRRENEAGCGSGIVSVFAHFISHTHFRSVIQRVLFS